MSIADELPVSFYDQVGGSAGVREAVDRFYVRVLADPALAGYFQGVDLARLKRHQALLLAQVLGGPTEYTGRTLAAAHNGMGISRLDFRRVAEHLLETLRSLQISDEVISAVDQTLAQVEPDIVMAGSAPERG
jgi:hemoglobin